MVELLHKLGSVVVICDLNATTGQVLETQLGSYAYPVDFIV